MNVTMQRPQYSVKSIAEYDAVLSNTSVINDVTIDRGVTAAIDTGMSVLAEYARSLVSLQAHDDNTVGGHRAEIGYKNAIHYKGGFPNCGLKKGIANRIDIMPFPDPSEPWEISSQNMHTKPVKYITVQQLRRINFALIQIMKPTTGIGSISEYCNELGITYGLNPLELAYIVALSSAMSNFGYDDDEGDRSGHFMLDVLYHLLRIAFEMAILVNEPDIEAEYQSVYEAAVSRDEYEYNRAGFYGEYCLNYIFYAIGNSEKSGMSAFIGGPVARDYIMYDCQSALWDLL